MSKYTLYDGDLGLDSSTTMNYDLKELMGTIMENHGNISWLVMGKETKGVIFISLDENDETKLTCHGSAVSPDYQGEENGPEFYLWVMIDKVEAAYRARFVTLEAATNIVKADFVNVQEPPTQIMEMAERFMTQVMAHAQAAAATRTIFYKGFAYGMLMSFLFMAVVVGTIILCM